MAITTNIVNQDPNNIPKPSQDNSYYEKLLNNPLFYTPEDLGTPDEKDMSYPSKDALGIPQPEGEGLELETYEEQNEETDVDEREEETEFLNGGDYSGGPSPEFIKRRGLPDGRDSAAQDDTSRPVQRPLQQPGPDPHFTRMSTSRMIRSNFRGAHIEYASDSRPTSGPPTKQWAVHDGVYRPTGKTVPVVPPGIYQSDMDMHGVFLVSHSVKSDSIIKLNDNSGNVVLSGIQKFWASKDRYRQHGVKFKRGVLMHGPPGSGKTTIINMLSEDLVSKGGIVIYCNDAWSFGTILSEIRAVEEDRPLICILEDFDEIVSNGGTHRILAVLDGETQIDNVCFIATTNYPDRLGARIINRPARFDQLVFVGMPSETDRYIYIKTSTKGQITHEEAMKWAKDTDGFSIAHIRELVVAVLCLEQPYKEALTRLESMYVRPYTYSGFAHSRLNTK